MTHTICKKCNKLWIFGDATICSTCTRQIKNEAIRIEKINITKEKLIDIIKMSGDLELIIDRAQSELLNGGVRLEHKDFVDVSNAYFLKNKTDDMDNDQQVLDDADMIYQQLDHANNMLLVSYP